MTTSIRTRAPAATSPTVRKVMQSNVSWDTGPELLLRKHLHRRGLRFRSNSQPQPDLKCKADIVFVGAKLCVFVDGCFWHGCPRHYSPPKTNTSWWKEKATDNIDRDHRKTRLLRSRGWLVIRIWEHEVRSDVERCADRISRAVLRRAAKLRSISVSAG